MFRKCSGKVAGKSDLDWLPSLFLFAVFRFCSGRGVSGEGGLARWAAGCYCRRTLKTNLDPTRAQVWDDFWGQQPSVADIYPAVSDVTAEVLRTLPELRGRRLLEVGAGTGREGHGFAERGAQVTLLDISWEALRLSRGVSSLPQFVRGNALSAPFADATFDVVYHQGLLEHFREPMPLLRENFRLLKPGGFLLCDVPQRYHVYTLAKHALMAVGKWFAGWETEFAPAEIERLVREAGFVVERRYGYGMHPGLCYRVLREIGKKTGVKLPMYPEFGPLRPLYRGWHHLLRRAERCRAGHYFVVSVGVIARKPRCRGAG